MITMEKVYSRQMAKLKKVGHFEVNRNLLSCKIVGNKTGV